LELKSARTLRYSRTRRGPAEGGQKPPGVVEVGEKAGAERRMDVAARHGDYPREHAAARLVDSARVGPPARRELVLAGNSVPFCHADKRLHHPLRHDEVSVGHRDRRPLPLDGRAALRRHAGHVEGATSTGEGGETDSYKVASCDLKEAEILRSQFVTSKNTMV
jgi:hypothetical protein